MLCLALAQAEPAEAMEPVPGVAEGPRRFEVLEAHAAIRPHALGFELVDAAAAAARVIVQCLLDGDDPRLLVTMNFRDAISARPVAVYTKPSIHQKCTSCNARWPSRVVRPRSAPRRLLAVGRRPWEVGGWLLGWWAEEPRCELAPSALTGAAHADSLGPMLILPPSSVLIVGVRIHPAPPLRSAKNTVASRQRPRGRR